MSDNEKQAKEAIAEAQRKLEPIIKTNDNFNRVLNLRENISDKRREIFGCLEAILSEIEERGKNQNINKKQLFMFAIRETLKEYPEWPLRFRQCNADEIRLMNILSKNREETLAYFSKSIYKLNQFKKDKQVSILLKKLGTNTKKLQKLLEMYLEITNEFYNYFDRINKRLELEKQFLKTFDYDTLMSYTTMVGAEFDKENELLEKIEKCQKEISSKLGKELAQEATKDTLSAGYVLFIAYGFKMLGESWKGLAMVLCGIFLLYPFLFGSAFLLSKMFKTNKETIEKLKSIRKTLSRL